VCECASVCVCECVSVKGARPGPVAKAFHGRFTPALITLAGYIYSALQQWVAGSFHALLNSEPKQWPCQGNPLGHYGLQYVINTIIGGQGGKESDSSLR